MKEKSIKVLVLLLSLFLLTSCDAIEQYQSLVQTVADDIGSSDLTLYFHELNPTIFTWVLNIIENVTFPVALVLLSAAFVIAILSYLNKIDFERSGFSYIRFFKLLGFYLIILYAIYITPKVYEFMYNFIIMIVRMLNSFNISSSTNINIALNPETIASLNDLNIMDGMIYTGIFSILTLAIKGAGLYVNLLLAIRMIKLYIYYAFAPAMTALAVHENYKQMAVNFIKSFIALALQTVLLYFIIAFIPYLFASLLGNVTNGFDMIGFVLAIVMYIVAVFMLLAQSNNMANSILQAR